MAEELSDTSRATSNVVCDGTDHNMAGSDASEIVSEASVASTSEETMQVVSTPKPIHELLSEITTTRIITDPALERIHTENESETPTSVHRTFAPLNIPLYRRRQTLTILVWFLLPWACFYITFLLLRCSSWYIVGAVVAYLTWMMLFQKYPREGGHRQQWLRRFEWWKWFAGKFSS